MDFSLEYKRWLEFDGLDTELKNELYAIKDNEKEIYERFYMPLSFGTAGLRGILRAGINGMNVYTVAQATEGLCRLIIKSGRQNDGVVIASDTRNKSDLFSRISAEVLAYNGIKVYIFDAPRPTPELSFAILHLKAVSGINITASHNPAEYNGYKAYWDDGAQLNPENAKIVFDEISKTDMFQVKRLDFEKGVKEGIIEVIGKDVDEQYMKAVLATRINPDEIPKNADKLKVVYTPLHGAGAKLVPEILAGAGLKHLYCVPEQMIPDGNFPTVKSPNPENRSCFDLAIPIAIKNDCDLLVGTDPDADRMGIVVRNKDGEYVSLTGNQVGALLLSYIIAQRKAKGTLPENAAAIKSIVSTKLADAICKAEGVRLESVLTGFKYIAEKMRAFEKDNSASFIFGFEESYGYLAGNYAYDKDSCSASLLICEMAAYYEARGMTLYDAMNEVYQKYGDYAEKVDDIVHKGADGAQKIKHIMASLREKPIKELCSNRVIEALDYKNGTVTTCDGTKKADLPPSDVLYYTFEDGVSVAIRPSGTEPKIKMYYLCCASKTKSAKQNVEDYRAEFTALLETL